jgi:hypothetical protein
MAELCRSGRYLPSYCTPADFSGLLWLVKHNPAAEKVFLEKIY